MQKTYIQDEYDRQCGFPSDVYQHLPTFKKYVDEHECYHVTEFGYRTGVSSFGFALGNCQKLISYDIQNPSKWGINVYERMRQFKLEGVEFIFKEENSLLVEIEETDLLFIDSWHCYKQLREELEIHAPKVRKFIMMHDTETYGGEDEQGYTSNYPYKFTNGKGLQRAINDFIEENKDTWEIHEVYKNNNGLTVLKRKN